MTYPEFIKQFSMRMIINCNPKDKRHNYCERKNNEYDIVGLGVVGGLNELRKDGKPFVAYWRIKTTNKDIVNVLPKISEYIKAQPIFIYSLNAQSLQNIIWELFLTYRREK